MHSLLSHKQERKKLGRYIEYICATMGHSLGHKLSQSIQETRLSQETPETDGATSCAPSDRTPSPSSSKHVRIREDEPRLDEGSDEHTCGGSSSREERVRRRRQKSRKERPSSLPPECMKDGIGAESQETEVEDSGECQPTRSRSRSHEECHYYKCKTPDDSKVQRKPSSSRKRSGRTFRNRDSLVDPSIDDNCPGVPENRVGRHRHHHQHVVCPRCVEGFKDVGVSPRSRRHRHKHRHSEHLGELDVSQELNFGQIENSNYVITLQDMKNSAKMLEGSGGTLGHTPENGKLNNQQQCRRYSKGMCYQRKDYSEAVEGLSVPPECSQFSSFKMLNNGWHDLAFPGESRTGRDSPHTDMAVFDLDLNSPRMMEVSDMNNMPLASGEGSTVKHFYLHDHHHYHHIIHHNKP